MELAYIWVKNFRNIESQGFNISSKLLFNYNEKENKVTVKKNPNYVKNFFGKNISNVTGIVGKNASGKTNLLELINYIMNEGRSRINSPFIVVYSQGDKHFGQYYKLKEPNAKSISFSEYTNINDYFNIVYFSNVFDGRRHGFSELTIDLSSNKILINQFSENVLTNYKKEIREQLEFFKEDTFELLGNRIRLKPNYVELTSPTWTNIRTRAIQFDKAIQKLTRDESFNGLKNLTLEFRKKISSSNSDYTLPYFTVFLLFVDYLTNKYIKDKESKMQDISNESFILKEVKSDIKILALDDLAQSRINEMHSQIIEIILPHFQNTYGGAETLLSFVNNIDNYNGAFERQENEGSRTVTKLRFISSFNTLAEKFIYGYLSATTNNTLTYNIDWGGISSGNKAFINLFSRFNSIKDKIKHRNILITIDEGDLYFHPKWQVEYFDVLIKILPKIFNAKNIQLILTTHSPFLVSDLPKDNILFIESDGPINFRVIPHSEIKGETFGGNIGELYLDAFFMEGRLISDFAAWKIKGVIERVKNKTTDEEDLKVIEMIGDSLIREQLKSMLSYEKN